MKKIILTSLLILSCIVSNAQRKNVYTDKTGICISCAGLIFTGVAFIPNGSDWTYTQQNGNRTITKTTLEKQPERVVCFGIGIIVTIGGIINYSKSKH